MHNTHLPTPLLHIAHAPYTSLVPPYTSPPARLETSRAPPSTSAVLRYVPTLLGHTVGMGAETSFVGTGKANWIAPGIAPGVGIEGECLPGALLFY